MKALVKYDADTGNVEDTVKIAESNLRSKVAKSLAVTDYNRNHIWHEKRGQATKEYMYIKLICIVIEKTKL